ncbi:MAG: hypothetical protein ACLPWO_05380 [Thermoplasmata archaeon]
MQQASTTALPDQQSISYPNEERHTPTEPTTTVSRFRVLTDADSENAGGSCADSIASFDQCHIRVGEFPDD